ncbi:3D domain-containing protein [Patescibacteria group bacterium]|nr:3D domain-containing protein [Patescibacteria group bacterium]MCL5410068.1 3D domain-containing protein [Patescibacteria group bacterium]
MQALIGGLIILIAALFFAKQPVILGASVFQPPADPPPISPTPANLQPIKTNSLFSDSLIDNTIAIPRQTVYKDDPNTEAGIDTTLNEGKDGSKTIITKITYYEGREYSREIVGTEIIPPQDKIISRGTKIVWRTLDTPDGQIRYWKKLHVWATHYDSHCLGCSAWTATGLPQGKGVIAVDPTIIKLGSKVYVPGYGPAIAGDTGGAIKGNIIDLGFPDAHTAGWYAHFVDIYILN